MKVETDSGGFTPAEKAIAIILDLIRFEALRMDALSNFPGDQDPFDVKVLHALRLSHDVLLTTSELDGLPLLGGDKD